MSLRSETMSLVQLYIPTEIARDTVLELGELGNVQFNDLNPDVNPFQRSFVGEIRRIDEMERLVKFFTAQARASSVPIRGMGGLDHGLVTQHGNRGPAMIDELEMKLKQHEERLLQMNSAYETLNRRHLELHEARHVLKETGNFFQKAATQERAIRSSFEDSQPLLDAHDPESQGSYNYDHNDIELEFVAGTIDRQRMPTLERVLWRVLRGNLFMNHSEIEEPFVDVTDPEKPPTRKNVFIVFAHGNELLAKIRKVSESMGATLQQVDAKTEKRNSALRDLSSRIDDLDIVLYNTTATRRIGIVKAAEHLQEWSTIVQKEKTIYTTLNLFNYDSQRGGLLATAWVPTGDILLIQDALRRAAGFSGTSVSAILKEINTHAAPPTFHRSSKFTEAFQAIIDSYGVATYQEVNPALFAVMTFPFLFAVMFGDIGHGFITACAATYMIMNEKKLAKAGLGEIFETFFFGRYIILLMGIFALFTGLMYNDLFSKSLHIWHSGWQWVEGSPVAESLQRVYPFGLDPAWHGTENSLVFTNSYKMKMSIIMGVVHMTFAICLNVPNYLHFKKPSSIWVEFVPQILFFHSIFGYLVICIIMKWCTDWSKQTTSPPGLLNMLIGMILSPGTVNPSEQMFAGQAFLQVSLLLLAMVCVPWMLCVKPYMAWKDMQKTKGYQGIASVSESTPFAISEDNDDEAEQGHVVAVENDESEEGHGENFNEIVIHQVIHTIEFCLGCISNTASYLRLWALSLAHAQLSEVLYSMTLDVAFHQTGISGAIIVFAMFAVWFVLTVVILCIMEGLSAFLHALRLHWVEANGKHYMAGGYAFTPLKFEEIDLNMIAE